jgi:hypothetical protein
MDTIFCKLCISLLPNGLLSTDTYACEDMFEAQVKAVAVMAIPILSKHLLKWVNVSDKPHIARIVYYNPG